MEEKYPNLAVSSHALPLKEREKDRETLMKFKIQRYIHNKILEPTHRTIVCFPHPHFTSTLIKAYLQHILTLYILSSYQEKNYKESQKLKTQFEETHQATEPDMAKVLELPDREFKATAINMLRALTDEVDSMQEHIINANRGIETPEKESK